MTDLATTTDVADGLGRSLTPDETTRAAALLKRASARFRKRARQQFTPGTSTVRVQSRNGSLRLQQWPVTAVTTIVDDDGAAITGWSWTSGQVVRDLPRCAWLTVTYEHGGVVPDDVIEVVCGMVTRVLNASPGAAAGATLEGTGPFQVSYAAWAVGGQVLLSPEDKAVADSYRPVSRSIEML